MAEQRLQMEGIPCLIRSLRGGPGLWGTAYNLPHDLLVYEGDESRAREVLEHVPQEIIEHEQDGVIDLLVTAISAGVTELAQQKQLINAEDIPVWLFSEGVPKKHITDTQATTMLRTLSLKHATNIPRELQQQALVETQALLDELW